MVQAMVPTVVCYYCFRKRKGFCRRSGYCPRFPDAPATATDNATADATDWHATDAAATIKFQIRATLAQTGIQPLPLL